MQSESIETAAAPQKVDYDNSQFYLGCVKWFNNKKGYGYVTVKEGPLVNEDIFTHHSAISIADGQYRYLVAGEYIHIQVKDYEGANHLYQANQVKAPCENGTIMCEVRTSQILKTKRFEQNVERSPVENTEQQLNP